jgi:hypothetical protein
MENKLAAPALLAHSGQTEGSARAIPIQAQVVLQFYYLTTLQDQVGRIGPGLDSDRRGG